MSSAYFPGLSRRSVLKLDLVGGAPALAGRGWSKEDRPMRFAQFYAPDSPSKAQDE
jgi:hypothetical protein